MLPLAACCLLAKQDTRTPGEEDAEGVMLGREMLAMVEEQLSGRQRQVLRLRLQQGLNQRQVAKKLGVSQQFVTQTEHSAVGKLRKLLPPQVLEHAKGMQALADGVGPGWRPRQAAP